MHLKRSKSSPGRGAASARRVPLSLLALTCLLFLSPAASAQPDGGKYLDAKFCSDTLNLNPGSDFDGGSCQLWKLVPDADGWSRLQLKHNGKFLDAKFCRDDVNMNPGSNFDNGSCQLWRFLPAQDGWARLQLKRNGKFLDATHCSDDVKLSGESDYDGGACQLWRLVPAGDGWSRLQIKFAGGAGPVAAGDEEFAWEGQTYGWYDEGWNGPGYYIIDFEFISGEGFGGREGWHGWHHHGSHHHGHKAHHVQGNRFKNFGHHRAAQHSDRGHHRNNLKSLGHHGAVHFKSRVHHGAGHGGHHSSGKQRHR